MHPQYRFRRSPGSDDVSFPTRPQTSITAGICEQELPQSSAQSQDTAGRRVPKEQVPLPREGGAWCQLKGSATFPTEQKGSAGTDV